MTIESSQMVPRAVAQMRGFVPSDLALTETVGQPESGAEIGGGCCCSCVSPPIRCDFILSDVGVERSRGPRRAVCETNRKAGTFAVLEEGQSERRLDQGLGRTEAVKPPCDQDGLDRIPRNTFNVPRSGPVRQRPASS